MASQNFRSAFNGFNREDVVHYLEYLNSRHTALVNQLTEEAENLRQKLTVAAQAIANDSARGEQIAALEAELEALQQQLSEARQAAEAAETARQALEAECISLRSQLDTAAAAVSGEAGAECAALRQQLAEAQAENVRLKEALEKAKAAPAVVAPVQAVPTEKELEAYRRAERTERLARERADQLYRQTNGVLAEASVKVDQVAADIGAIADQVVAQLQQLQQAVSGSKNALKEAADLMYTIRPEDEEV